MSKLGLSFLKYIILWINKTLSHNDGRVFMKKILLTASFLAFLCPNPAHARPKFLSWWWWESHWTNQDFAPYYDNGTDTQNSQWTNSNWTPADWIQADGGDGVALVKKWVTVGIIAGSYKDSDDVPYLDVGPNFYHLSGYDKRRVMETVDAVYQITNQKPAMFFLKDPATRKDIGTYTKEGLTLE
jgi:hypothetical protein